MIHQLSCLRESLVISQTHSECKVDCCELELKWSLDWLKYSSNCTYIDWEGRKSSAITMWDIRSMRTWKSY